MTQEHPPQIPNILISWEILSKPKKKEPMLKKQLAYRLGVKQLVSSAHNLDSRNFSCYYSPHW
ncbi:MAG: hypothetical protein BRC36_17290 [Cyanobacteria bacterium QH_2_48_84]|nr:MAG: hypothetical protein BRC36_17290 [Cyanobacteria bacterium QH_2_48_84]